MLTATYTLVALAVEQSKARASVQALQQGLLASFSAHHRLSAGQVGYACDALRRINEHCQWRKLELFLVPAIRRASAASAPLLVDLEALSDLAAVRLAELGGPMGAVALDGDAAVARFCAAIDAFCTAILCRLEREERELFPVARAAISGENWFAIANQMLVHDAYEQETKPARQPVMLGLPTRTERAAERGCAAGLSD
ncbi:MAG: hypothetical protein V4508_23620 [Pseudomonadota bacterium]